MKRNDLLLVLVAVLLMIASGCVSRYAMTTRSEMFMAPALDNLSANKMTIIATFANPVMELAEGGGGRFAWKSARFTNDGQEFSYLTLNFNLLDREVCRKKLITVLPGGIAENQGYFGTFNRVGLKLYNQRGEFREVRRLGKLKPEDYKDFLPRIEPGHTFIVEVNSESREFKNLVNLYQRFRIAEVEAAVNYVYRKYGSILTPEQLEKLRYDDTIVAGITDWLGRDWKAFFAMSTSNGARALGIKGMILTAGVVKILSFPSIWGDKINRPGYAEYIMTAEDSAEMFFRGTADYGVCLK